MANENQSNLAAHSSDIDGSQEACIYLYVATLEKFIAGRKALALQRALSTYFPGMESLDRLKGDCAPGNLAQPIAQREAELAGAVVLVEFLKSTPQYIEAAATIEPLLAREIEQEAAATTLRLDIEAKRGSVNQALADARARAVANAENDPAVIAARKALAKAIPAGMTFPVPEPFPVGETVQERDEALSEIAKAEKALADARALGARINPSDPESYREITYAQRRLDALKKARAQKLERAKQAG
jgi:hypothetical protein